MYRWCHAFVFGSALVLSQTVTAIAADALPLAPAPSINRQSTPSAATDRGCVAFDGGSVDRAELGCRYFRGHGPHGLHNVSISADIDGPGISYFVIDPAWSIRRGIATAATFYGFFHESRQRQRRNTEFRLPDLDGSKDTTHSQSVWSEVEGTTIEAGERRVAAGNEHR